MPVRRPIWGFGPVGWVLLAIAAALAVSLITGYDLRYQLQRAIHAAFGWQGSSLFASRWLPFQYFALTLPQFALIGLAYALIAMHLSSMRFGAWRYCLLITWSVFAPAFFGDIYRLVSQFPTPWGSVVDLAFASALLESGTAVVLWVLTRSLAVSAATCLLAVAAAFATYITEPIAQVSPVVIAVSWHAAMATTLMTWAIRSRWRRCSPHECHVCGYDLRGVTKGPCPECGAARRDAQPNQAQDG